MKKYLLILFVALGMNATLSAQEYLIIGSATGDATPVPVSEIDSITFGIADDFLPDQIARDPRLTLFSEALELTGLDDSLRAYKNMDYKYEYIRAREFFGHRYYSFDRLPTLHYRYTAFVETDEVLAAKGIHDIDGLMALAAQIYDEAYPDDASVSDPTDRRHSLNRFMAYHFIDRYADYDDLVNFYGTNPKLKVPDDWYPTLAPNTMMRCSGWQKGSDLYINRTCGTCTADTTLTEVPDHRGVYVRGAMITRPSAMPETRLARNGVYHYIDDIIHYGKDTQQRVFNTLIRIHAANLSPEFMNVGNRVGMVNRGGTDLSAKGYYYPKGCLKNFDYGENNDIFKFQTYIDYWCYQGTELNFTGSVWGMDMTIQLPTLPEGTYELRTGFCSSHNKGQIQYSINGEACGEPVEQTNRLSTYIPDEYKTAEETVIDSVLRISRYMKGPKAVFCGGGDSATPPNQNPNNGTSFRQIDATGRIIIGTYESDGKTPIFLNLKHMDVNQQNPVITLDYIEFCPVEYSKDLESPENIY